ncbi:MAG: rhomboid family intramembrane serine protease [Zetaproteobacteria bacterium]|nr:rhomboid family intramembrane serine protease [Zetaproteobacteria bacterium]
MRKVATFAKKELADRFALFLSSKGIESATDFDLDESGASIDQKEGIRVWVTDGRYRDQARGLLPDFMQTKDSATSMAELQRARQAKEASLQQERSVHTQRIAVGSTPQEAPGTLFLLATAVVIFLFVSASRASRLEIHLMFIPQLILQGEVWRIFTPMVLHTDFLHILFNAYWLYRLGMDFEWNFGTARLLKLAGTVAVISHTLFYLAIGPSFLGASGLIYALVGYIWAAQWAGSGVHLDPDYQQSRFFLIWFVISMVLKIAGMPVANIIHAVGAMVGILAAFYSYLRIHWIRKELEQNATTRRNAAIGVGLFFAAFVVDMFL